MSNLGLYKTMTVAAHAVGGPVVLGLGMMAIGYFAGKAIENIIKTNREKNNVQYKFSSKIYK